MINVMKERSRREQAEVEIEKLERDKNVLIQQRREDHKQLEKLMMDYPSSSPRTFRKKIR